MKIGVGIGAMAGAKAGVNALDGAAAAPNVDTDGPGGWYVPATSAEFTAELGLPAPTNLWLCQDAVAGNIADALGAANFVRQAGGGSFQQTVSGWTRKGVGPGGPSYYWMATGVNLATTSAVDLFYFGSLINAGGNSTILDVGTSPRHQVFVNSTPRLRANNVGAETANPTTSLPRAILRVYDRANSALIVYSDQEVITNTYSTGLAGTPLYLFEFDGGVQSAASLMWACRWTGAAAEGLANTNALAETLLNTLGITVSW